MLKIGNKPISILIMFILAFCAWDFIFRENEWVRTLGIGALDIMSGVLSFLYLLKACHTGAKTQKIFLRLLTAGVILYLSANVIGYCLYVVQKSPLFSQFTYIIGLFAYIFFLLALIYKTKHISADVSKSYNFFNILTFIVTVAAISFYYLVKLPINRVNHSLSYALTSLGYTVTDLSIFFVITILFSLTHRRLGKKMYLFIITGFFLQVAADLGYTYLSLSGKYYTGHIIDLAWMVSILFIGFASLYAEAEPKREKEEYTRIKEAFFSYGNILILILLCANSYRWDFNPLSFGVLIIFLMVLVRQIIISNRNNRLMGEYKYLAYHDPLTGLHNRVSFNETLDRVIAKNRLNHVALLLIDLDRFKVINDTLGHESGDRVLIETAERLILTLKAYKDTRIFRLGGDEFVIILPNASEKKCSSVAESILKSFQTTYFLDEHEIVITASIGISIYPENGGNSQDLLKQADAAMYLVKEDGKNGFGFYNTELHKMMERKVKIENDLGRAIEGNQFTLVYQPKVHLHTKKLVGMEALLRWQHPELGWISPEEFIPIAEEIGEIVSIGEWVLRKACKQNKLWQDQGFPPLIVSVNVSVRQFQHSGFLATVQKGLQETKLNPQFLELEITESIMQNTSESIKILGGLRKVGVKISIDDFGTGYSSLYILQKMPVDTIKIDKSFIDDIEDKNQQSMVRTIINLGLNLNLDVVAEGIEDEQQLNVLIENNCHIGQGFLFSKPVAPKELESKFLKKLSKESGSGSASGQVFFRRVRTANGD